MVISDRDATPTIGVISDQADVCKDVNCPLNSACRKSDESFICECKDRGLNDLLKNSLAI